MTTRARSGAVTLIAAIVASISAGCSPRDNGTLLVVRVDTDLSVPGQLDSVVIDVVPERGASFSTGKFVLKNAASLPVTLGLNPKGAPDFGVEVTARGLLADKPVVAQTATVQFTPGQAQEFTLFLSSDCTAANACPATQVCLQGHRCVMKNAVAQLRPYVAGGTNRDGGSDQSAAETPPDLQGGDTTADATGAAGKDGSVNPGTWGSVAGVPTAVTLSAVWPFADNDVWVAGAQAAGVVFHYDGTGFTPSAVPAGTPALYGLWASGPGDLWAVGAGGTVLHLVNNVWTSTKIVGTPAPVLSAIWGAKADDIWIVGSGGRTFHGDGMAFTPVASNVTSSLFAVSGSVSMGGAVDVWAVGAGGTIIRHQGNAWAPVTQRLSQTIFYGVWAGGPSDVWVAGDGAALHFDGASWTAASGEVDVSLAIWGSATDDVWTAGRPSLMMGSTIARWDGVAFGDAMGPSGTTLQAVRGSSRTNVWAAGTNGAVFRFQSR